MTLLAEKYRQRAVELTSRLVEIESVNPPGNEYAVAALCRDFLKELGLKPIFDEYAPGRVNVTTYVGDPDDVSLILNGHMDVVPATGEWRYPPFSGHNDGARIWGRGAADMKSGCACMLAAVQAIVEEKAPLRHGFCLSLTSDEELMGAGIRRLLERHRPKAAAAVIGEPTCLQVHYGNRGYASLYIRTRGVACHACEPNNGVNAIYKMGHVIVRLEQYAAELRKRTNPQLGCVTFSLGLIKGGTCLNTVPAECEIVVECRGFPGMSAETLKRELEAILPQDTEIEIRSNLIASLIPEDAEIIARASDALCRTTGSRPLVTRFPAWAETGFFTELCGIPTILLGPGDIARAHRIDEYVEIEEIRAAAQAYYLLVKDYTR